MHRSLYFQFEHSASQLNPAERFLLAFQNVFQTGKRSMNWLQGWKILTIGWGFFIRSQVNLFIDSNEHFMRIRCLRIATKSDDFTLLSQNIRIVVGTEILISMINWCVWVVRIHVSGSFYLKPAPLLKLATSIAETTSASVTNTIISASTLAETSPVSNHTRMGCRIITFT